MVYIALYDDGYEEADKFGGCSTSFESAKAMANKAVEEWDEVAGKKLRRWEFRDGKWIAV